ncbi:DUF1127 domain-containing protein [Ruegeria sp. SCPT10]|uniref:DUF1127 domain-containing protein n=1 Tax=Ruegeria sp. SCP10 TaxID=3141377 RepID=UPI0033380408
MTQIALKQTRQNATRPMMSLIHHMFAVRRQRRRLVQLDNTYLEDIGITREEAMEEARRYLWDAPNYWKR